MKEKIHNISARSKIRIAETSTPTTGQNGVFERMSPHEHQQFVQQIEEEEKSRLASLTPNEVEALIGRALFGRLAHVLYLERSQPFGTRPAEPRM